MDKKLKILFLEDSQSDFELMKRQLNKENISFISKRVETEEDFIKELKDLSPDLILSDYSLPNFDGKSALKIAKKIVPDIPFIMVTGSLSEEIAVTMMKAGVWDYVMKDNLIRLGPAVKRTLKEAEEHRKRKHAEQKLRELDQAIEQTLEGIGIADMDGKFVFSNPAWAEMHGYHPADLIGKPAAMLDSPEDRKNFPKVWEEIKEKGFWRGELHRLRKDGSSFPAIMTSSLVTDDMNRPIGIVGVCLDITHRKQAEESLKASEEKYRQLAETDKDVIMVLDLKGNVKYINQEGIDISGYSKEEVLKMNIKDVLPDDKIPISDKNFAKRIKGDKSIFMYEIDFFNKKGNKIPVEIKSSLIIEQGKPASVLITARDITERKQAEEALRRRAEEMAALVEMNRTITEDIDLKETLDRILSNAQKIIPVSDCSVILVDESSKDLVVEASTNGETGIRISSAAPSAVGWVVKTKQILTEEDVSSNPILSQQLVQRYGFKSGLAVPIIYKDKAIGTLSFGNRHVRCAFSDSEKMMAQSFAYQAAIAIQNVRLFEQSQQEITKRKKVEEKIKAKSLFLESLIQQSPLPTFVMDSKGFVVIVNEAFLKFYAVPNKEMILGRNALTEPANVKQGVVKYFEEALKGKIVEMSEIEFVSPYKNEKVITRCTQFPILDPTGTLTNVVIMQEDITERKHAQEELHKRLKELETFNRIAVGRELRMIELKKEINELHKKSGKEAKYKIAE